MMQIVTRILVRATPIAALILTLAGAPTAAAAEPAIAVYSAGLEGLIVDETDRGLRAALRLLAPRLAELPDELDEPDVPGPMLAMLADMLMSPMTARLDALAGIDDGGPPFTFQLTVAETGGGAARRQADTLADMLTAMGAEDGIVPGPPGFEVLDLDGVPAFVGTSRAGGGSVFVAALRTVAPGPVAPPPCELPAGVEPAFVFDLHGEGFSALLESVASEMPPQAAEAMRLQVAAYGFTGATPPSVHVAFGYDDERTHGVLRATHYASNELYRDLLVREPLGPAHLALVPADATYAQIVRVDLAGFPDYFRNLAASLGTELGDGAAEMDEMMESIAEVTGVHPERDVFAHLGTVAGWYTAERTGGGGIGSAVGFVELRDPAAFAESWSRVIAFMNDMGRGAARGYVRVDTREIEGRTVSSLHFPGLPIPIAPSWAVVGNHLVGAVSVHGLLAALDQIGAGETGLDDHPRFRAERTAALDRAITVQFADTPALAGRGYGMVSLAMDALANAVRSPRDATRDPGLLMPSYPALTSGGHGSLTTSHLEGDDLVVTIRADRSVTRSLAAGVGIFAGSPAAVAVAGLGAGILLPALGKARSNAKDVKGMTQLRQLSMAVMVYAAEHNDMAPPSVDVLLEEGYFGPDLLGSPHGPALDDGPDTWFNPSIGTLAKIRFPDRHILAYDRAMYAAGHDTVNVVFVDGHVEGVPRFSFDELLEDPIHDGLDFDLPWE